MPTTVYVTCLFCEKEIKQGELHSHRLNCEKGKALCQCCLEFFSTEDIENHEQQCSVKVDKNTSKTSWLKETVEKSDVDEEVHPVPCDKLDVKGKVLAILCDNFSKKEDKSDLRDKRVQREVQCVFCDEELLDLVEHYDSCKCILIRCVNDCGKKLPRKDLSEHIENECHQTVIECEYCKKEVKKQLLADHHSKCPKFPIPCPTNCGVKVRRGDVKRHLDENCWNCFAACAYKEMQCLYYGAPAEKRQHVKKEMQHHLEITKSVVEELCYRVGSLENELKIERARNERLEKKINKLEANVLSEVKIQEVSIPRYTPKRTAMFVQKSRILR